MVCMEVVGGVSCISVRSTVVYVVAFQCLVCGMSGWYAL